MMGEDHWMYYCVSKMDDPFKCILVEGSGGYDKLKQITLKDVEEASKKDLGKSISLTVGPGDVLIRTHAVGVNYADVCVRMGNERESFFEKEGLYASAKKYVGWPICPGFEFSGTVLEIGSGGDDETERKFKEKGNHHKYVLTNRY